MKKGSSLKLRLRDTRQEGRAKDGESRMSLEGAPAVVPVECVVGGRVAWPQSLAAAGVAVGDALRRRSAHGDHLAAGRGRERRLPGLLLLPGRRRTQERIGGDAAVGAGAVRVVPARAAVAGDRRFAHEALRPEGRRRGRSSQSDARSGRSAVSLWARLGHDFAGPAASALGFAGVAAAGIVVRPPADDRHDSQVPSLAAIRHQAAIGGPLGRVGRSALETSRKKRVARRRRRLYQAPVPAACPEDGRDDRRPAAQGRGACATCRRS